MKNIVIILAVLTVSCTAVKRIIVGKPLFGSSKVAHNFTINDIYIYMDGVKVAKYQAKTYSLDAGELVEEYNLSLIDNNIKDKQVIGDLIEFVSDRHQGAEVEIEIDSNGSIFKL